MKPFVVSLLVALLLVWGIHAQSRTDTVDSHVAAARAAAGKEHVALFDTICVEPPPPRTAATAAVPAAAPAPAAPPDRAKWHADPVKVFDNLYFLGQSEYSAWAVTTSDGIIVIDALFDYSVEDEVANGLTRLGLDPKKIKYVIVSHGHSDHAGGAKYLQDHFAAHVVASAADWDLMEADKGRWLKPKRDMVASDGQKLTLGDTTLTMYLTPGHTLGTISTLIPVKDNGTPHMVAEWGGTAFNWLANRSAYITKDRPDAFWFDAYIKSAARFRDIAGKAGADVLIANHLKFDGSMVKLPALKKRKAGEPNPYVIGKESVQRYMTVAEECGRAGSLRLQR